MASGGGLGLKAKSVSSLNSERPGAGQKVRPSHRGSLSGDPNCIKLEAFAKGLQTPHMQVKTSYFIYPSTYLKLQ